MGKLLYIFSLYNYFSACLVDFRALHPSTMKDAYKYDDVASVLQRIHYFLSSDVPQFHFEPGIQDKRRDCTQQNAFSKTVPFLLCLDLDKIEGKTKGMNQFRECY